MLGLIFGGTGLFFFLIGVIFLILHYNNKSSLKKIVDNGYYIMAEISNIDMNYNVNVNGRCPYVIYARYQDMNGCIYTFHSRNIFFYPAGMMKNNMVKIYTRPDNFKKYYMEMIRTVKTSEITENIKEMCIEANYYLSRDMDAAMKNAAATEESELGQKILNQLQDNLEIADKEQIPICQDTGMAVVFIEVGQDVHFEGDAIEDAINEGVRQGYVEGYLRKSVVKDPLIRENTKDNTPAVIHYSIVPGNKVKMTVAPKGFGSENMSRVFMLKPAEGIEGVKNAIMTAVADAGPNACPPMVVGVGIGGTFEKCAILAKKALTRSVDSYSEIPYVKNLEIEMLDKINKLGIGPGGLGGTTTALKVNINTYPTHIAGLPVAVNICCHVNRHVVREI